MGDGQHLFHAGSRESLNYFPACLKLLIAYLVKFSHKVRSIALAVVFLLAGAQPRTPSSGHRPRIRRRSHAKASRQEIIFVSRNPIPMCASASSGIGLLFAVCGSAGQRLERNENGGVSIVVMQASILIW